MNPNPLCPKCRSNIVECADKIPSSILGEPYFDTAKCKDCGCLFINENDKNPMQEQFNFGNVIAGMKLKASFYRKGWNGKGMWIELQTHDDHSKMTRPYIFMSIPVGATEQFGGDDGHPAGIQRVPWLASQTDILAEDWLVADDEYKKGKK